MSKWTVPRMWEGGECWIIGGGPSLPYQFDVPEKVIQKVRDGIIPMSVYSEYMEALHDKHVIGINIAYMLGNWISVCYFCDLTIFRNYKYQLLDWHNLKVTDTGNMPPRERYLHCNIKKLRRNNKYGLDPDPDRIRWNRNSGGGAIDLAVHFGCKRILLLGFDMKADDGGKTHFHSGLPCYSNPTLERSFTRFLKCFPFIANDAEKLGVEILNVNPDSAIEDFKKVRLEDVL